MAAPLAANLTSASTAPFAALTRKAGTSMPHEKARAAAQDFEAVFLNTMLSEMFTGIGKEGPMGGGAGVDVWRSFLTDEYAKTFARSGGIGIADHVYKSLIATQEAAAK
jgi:peptidoglycan hydrolase FlgJ